MANTALQALHFIDSDGKPIHGLVPVRDRGARAGLSVDEHAAVIDAESFERIDYVFFRRFTGGRSSQVAAYVVDNNDKRLDKGSLARLHQQVWIHGTAPLLYVAWPSRIDVLACARGADFWVNDERKYKPASECLLETAAKVARELQRFSAFRLADGTFWEDTRNKALANYAKAAHQSLIQAVVEADKALEGAKNPVLRRLLLLVVLIKYLEDRDVFPNRGWFGQWHKGARTFFDVLKGGKPDEVCKLLDFLERKFNGDVFKLSSGHRQELTRQVLKGFGELVEGRTLDGQRHFWKQFSFEHLPVEIISHLYQRFVKDGHGAVYTPPLLASLLLDHAMPYAKLSGKERVLDPACGSGVFLVGAFRRLINVWRSKNGWRKPDVHTLKKILKRSIYGIEWESFAVDLTAFSLSLAICDALTPDVIWKELTFDKLGESNLFEADFFAELRKSRSYGSSVLDDRFDIIIGNPPFESELTVDAAKVDKAAQRENKERGPVPDKQIAYLFLEQALTLLNTDGRICLIQPSGFLYNRNTKAFRETIFRRRQIETILDFTSIRKLYKADKMTIAVFARAGEPADDHEIKHWTFRRTVSVHERICFELDHYDRHRVPQKLAESDPYVWRANLLGGGRLVEISQRLRGMRTLAEYLEEKKQNGWDYGEGFIAAKKEPRTPAPFLTGKWLLPTRAFTDAGIDESQITEKVTHTHFRSAYKKDRFSPPLVLIKEVGSLPIDYWDEGCLAYRAKIIGIHAPPSKASTLRKLYGALRRNHGFYQFCCALNGTQSLVGKATAILKQDIDALPYPENLQDLSLAFWEQALCEDTLEFMADYVRLGQNSQLLKDAANTDDLQKYSKLFVRMLGSIYDNLHASAPIFLNGLTCQPFYFGKSPNLPWLGEGAEDELRTLIYDDVQHESLRTIRVLRFYTENVMLVVKPDRLRYWIRSTAIRDADETLVVLRGQGY
ncbi:MAG: N-6 DNA methylase [Planctomycetes bacterium]|nr:N-6 DNA methylase [Planctomycetota bacterium]